MTHAHFAAQSITQTKTVGTNRRLEITFVNEKGDTQTISLPVQIAASSLAPIMHQLTATNPSPPGGPLFMRDVKRFAVGSSNDLPLVLLFINQDAPLAFPLADATKLWHQLREEVDKVSRRPTPSRQ